MGLRRKFIDVMGIATLLAMTMIGFQNCSLLSPSQSTSSKASGGGFDGMKYLSYGYCTSNILDVVSAVVVASDFRSASFVRQNCQDLNVPQPLDVSTLGFASQDKTAFVLGGKIFDQQAGISSVYDDGLSRAPSGTGQHPNQFLGYLARPPWKVAGVDYPVGFPTGTALKDPMTINIPGVVLRTDIFYVEVQGDNVVLDGYDFSLEGGWLINITGQNATIQNSYFKSGANGNDAIYSQLSAGNVTIQYNVFDGNSTKTLWGALITTAANGTNTVQYNWFKNAWSNNIDFAAAQDVVGSSTIIRYNLMENNAQGTSVPGNWIATFGTSSGLPPLVANLIVDYNTVLMTQVGSGTTAQGFSAGGAGVVVPEFLGGDMSFNSIFLPVANTTEFAFAYSTDQINGQVFTNHDNYFDPTGISLQLYLTNTGGGKFSGGVTLTNNINMLTGQALPLTALP